MSDPVTVFFGAVLSVVQVALDNPVATAAVIGLGLTLAASGGVAVGGVVAGRAVRKRLAEKKAEEDKGED